MSRKKGVPPPMEPQDHSQSLTPLRAETFAHRAPARGEREGFGPDSNPLLWKLLRYRRFSGFSISAIVCRHFAGGVAAGMGVELLRWWSGWFSSHPEQLRGAAMVASLVALWLAATLYWRIRRWESRSFLDEVLLTELSPREICSAIAQMGARAKAAFFVGLLSPIFFRETGFAFHRGPGEGVLFVLAFTTVAAFLVLSFHAIAWLTLWIIWRGRFAPLGALLAAGWITVLPVSAGCHNQLVLGGAAIVVVAMTLNSALVLAPRVPGLLLSRGE